MNTNEDLRALLTDLRDSRLMRLHGDAYMPRIEVALARQEEGREAVGHDSDRAQHNAPATPAGPCDCSIAPIAWIPRDHLDTLRQYRADGYQAWVEVTNDGKAAVDPIALYTHPAPPSAGEGDAEVARLRQALQDVADPIGYLRREAEAKGERLGGMAYSIANDLHFVKQIASRALATPTPQSGEAGVERGLPTDRRMKAVELLLSQGYRWSEGEWIAPASPQAADTDEWEVRADGQRVRKDRWETGFRNIVSILVGARTEFEIPDIVERVRALTTAGQQAAGVSEEMVSAVRFAPTSAYWSEKLVEFFGPEARSGIDALDARIRELTAAGAAPEGFRATDEQIAEWLERHDLERAIGGSDARAAFEDAQTLHMLAATPNPGAQHGQEGRE